MGEAQDLEGLIRRIGEDVHSHELSWQAKKKAKQEQYAARNLENLKRLDLRRWELDQLSRARPSVRLRTW